MIAETYVNEICKIGQGVNCCRYLGASRDGMHCLKLDPEFKAYIDARVAANTMGAKGDNCEGQSFDD